MDTHYTKPEVWPSPYTCKQPYHPGRYQKIVDSVMWSFRLKGFAKNCLGKYKLCYVDRSPKRLSMVAWFPYVCGLGERGGTLQPPSLEFWAKHLYDSGKSNSDKLFIECGLYNTTKSVPLLPICRSLAIVNTIDKIIIIFGQHDGRKNFFFE